MRELDGTPSEKAQAMDSNPSLAGGSGSFTHRYWCRECEEHLVDAPGLLCPVCSPTRRDIA